MLLLEFMNRYKVSSSLAFERVAVLYCLSGYEFMGQDFFGSFFYRLKKMNKRNDYADSPETMKGKVETKT